MSTALENIGRCFHGVVPSVIATCAADGTPNVTYLSQVYYVDSRRVALSCQFFNKTKRNVEENPYACVQMYDPLTFEAYRLRLRFEHAETTGALFDTMSARIDAIATLTGMAGIFKLISADIYQVLSVEKLEGFIAPPDVGAELAGAPVQGPLSELRGIHTLSDRINRAHGLDELIQSTMAAMHELFGFAHSMLLVPDESSDRLVALATYGYSDLGVGAEVKVGDGLIGTVAKERCVLRMSIGAELRYGRAIRDRVEETDARALLRPEIALPGLPNAESQIVLPLLVQDRLIGVLAIESEDPCAFNAWHEAYLGIIANQIAVGIERWSADDEEERPTPPPFTVVREEDERPRTPVKKTFHFYKNDDCVFVDGEYLIRNIPGKILWKLLLSHAREGRSEFTNRELRLDPFLGLPAIKDNLESRLILLRKRLEQKCPDVKLVPKGRGRFALELGSPVELVEKESA